MKNTPSVYSLSGRPLFDNIFRILKAVPFPEDDLPHSPRLRRLIVSLMNLGDFIGFCDGWRGLDSEKELLSISPSWTTRINPKGIYKITPRMSGSLSTALLIRVWAVAELIGYCEPESDSIEETRFLKEWPKAFEKIEAEVRSQIPEPVWASLADARDIAGASWERYFDGIDIFSESPDLPFPLFEMEEVK